MSSSPALKPSSRRFLRTLKEKGLLTEAEPELIRAFFERAQQALRSARILLPHDREGAVTFAYYSRLYAASALLAKTGIRCRNHTGTHLLLRDLFAITSLKDAKEERERLQYDPEAFVTANDAKRLVQEAERFVNELYDRTEKTTRRELDL